VPDLLPGNLNPFPVRRPVGLRRRYIRTGTELWRLDADAPANWDWEGFPVPRNRFDPASRNFRVRYASRSLVGAVRERYRASGLFVPADHARHHLVQLVATRDLRAFDLRVQQNLDVLDLDDQISTGQHPEVWNTCHRLVDSARIWWDDLDVVVYRSRTTPATSVNVAFFSTEALQAQSWVLIDRADIVADLIFRARVHL
jgi:RES domain